MFKKLLVPFCVSYHSKKKILLGFVGIVIISGSQVSRCKNTVCLHMLVKQVIISNLSKVCPFSNPRLSRNTENSSAKPTLPEVPSCRLPCSSP